MNVGRPTASTAAWLGNYQTKSKTQPVLPNNQKAFANWRQRPRFTCVCVYFIDGHVAVKSGYKCKGEIEEEWRERDDLGFSFNLIFLCFIILFHGKVENRINKDCWCDSEEGISTVYSSWNGHGVAFKETNLTQAQKPPFPAATGFVKWELSANTSISCDASIRNWKCYDDSYC